MFGHNSSLGDLIELIASNHDTVVKIVRNVPEPRHSGRPSLDERLARLLDLTQNPLRVNGVRTIDLIPLAEFTPTPGEKAIIGFSGMKIASLRTLLRDRWGIAFNNLFHATARMSPDAEFGEGVILQAGAVIRSGARIWGPCMDQQGSQSWRSCSHRTLRLCWTRGASGLTCQGTRRRLRRNRGYRCRWGSRRRESSRWSGGSRLHRRS